MERTDYEQSDDYVFFKQLHEINEELDVLDEFSEINREARFVSMVMEQYHGEKIGTDELEEVIKFSEIDSLFNTLKVFFEHEYDSYLKQAEKNKDLYSDNKIEELWRRSISRSVHENFWFFKYPLRGMIEKSFSYFIEDKRYLYDLMSGFHPEFIRIIEEYPDINSGEFTWNKRLKYLRQGLSYFRENMPGSTGHMLWILLYLYEINCWGRDDNTRYISPVNELSVNMLEYQLAQCVTDTRYNLSYSNGLSFYMTTQKVSPGSGIRPAGKTFYGEYDRVSRVLHSDKHLRERFFHTRGKGQGTRCFAVLTDRKSNHYIAISGYNIALYKSIFSLFQRKSTLKYTLIDPVSYGKSLYGWSGNGSTYREISKDDLEYRIKNWHKNLKYPSNYDRMYSCAERRLVDKYESIKSSQKNHPGDYIILSRKQPCYMCERVLKEHSIPTVYYLAYTMSNEASISRELDTFADSV